jgi:two-component system, OmpR family, KDP operon response regulator KdpE
MKTEPAKPVIVIIDDEVQIRRLLRVALEANGYKVFEAADGKHGLEEVAARRPDLVILDLGLPDVDGLDLILRLREWTSIPVIVLSVREGEHDKVTALRSGADDYLSKPFSTAELLARLQVALRHVLSAGSGGETTFRTGPLTVNLASRSVTINGKPVKLTGTEYALLRLFVRNPGKVLTHPQIMEAVWGPGHRDKTHYLHVYMTYLREKLEAVPGKPKLLVTEARVGYRLNVEDFVESASECPPVTGATN